MRRRHGAGTAPQVSVDRLRLLRESDDSFPTLVKRLSAGMGPEGVPGVIYRKGDESTLAAPADKVHDMDRLPDPDYDDYFAALGRSSHGSS